ncbi:hypothetical protein WME73_18405 [Sorangium sp. So ce302]|uniref:hypothetical protein n=1 Tax=Sorangium sp. So ce302 TaxID=3133297 RepID=UPI003F648900
MSTGVKIEGDSIKKIEGRTASWNKARTTAFSRAGQRDCRPLSRLGDRSSEQRAAGGRRRWAPPVRRERDEATGAW